MQLVQRGCGHQVMSTRRVEQAANQEGMAGDWTQVSKWGEIMDMVLATQVFFA
jgi:hypothetical protein